MKQTYRENKQGKQMELLEKWKLLPLQIILTVLPLIMYLKTGTSGYSIYPWNSERDTYADVFLHGKMIVFEILALVLLVLLVLRLIKLDKWARKQSLLRFLPILLYSFFVLLSTICSKNFAYSVLAEDMQNMENIDRKVKAFQIFSNCTFEMIQGEFVDISLEGKEIEPKELYYMHDYKTAALLKGALTMGAVLGGASLKQVKKLEEYAEKIGLAFQIKDDILSFVGDEKILGKPIGNDEERGKNTFVTVLGLEKAKRILEETIQDALRILSEFTDINTVFLEELAIFIKERDF